MQHQQRSNGHLLLAMYAQADNAGVVKDHLRAVLILLYACRPAAHYAAAAAPHAAAGLQGTATGEALFWGSGYDLHNYLILGMSLRQVHRCTS
jgi:hypothetical protein